MGGGGEGGAGGGRGNGEEEEKEDEALVSGPLRANQTNCLQSSPTKQQPTR